MAEDLELVSLFRGSIGKVLNFLLTAEEENSKSEIARRSDVTFKTVCDIWPILEKYDLVTPTRTIGMAKLYTLNKSNKIVGQLGKIRNELTSHNGNHNGNHRGIGEIFSIYGFLLLLTLPIVGTLYFESNNTVAVDESLLNITTIIDNTSNFSENLTAQTEPEVNITTITADNQSADNATQMIPIETMVQEINYSHGPIEIGQRVQWTRVIKTSGGENYIIGLDLPSDYQDLTITDPNGYSFDNGTFVLSGSHTIEIKFTTSPVQKIEETLSEKPYQKRVIVLSESALHYSNVTVSTTISEKIDAKITELPDKDITNDAMYDVRFLDTDGNGKVDSLSWVVPGLSQKEYIIEDSKEKSSLTTFDRALDCHKCGMHKAPPLTDVNMTISASFSGTKTNVDFSDYFPNDWQIMDYNNGTVTAYNASHSKITWQYDSITGSVSQWYIIKSGDLTSPPTQYEFYSSFDSQMSDPWRVIVSDLKTVGKVVISGVTADIVRGEQNTITCTITQTSTAGAAATNVSLQYNSGAANPWIILNATNKATNVSLVRPYPLTGANPNQTGDTSLIYNFRVSADVFSKANFRCNASNSTLATAVSTVAVQNISAIALNTTIATVPAAPITIYNDQSDNFNITCNVTALRGNASNASVYAQWNSTADVWNNFSTGAGNMRANESSPVSFSMVDNSTNPDSRVFLITGYTSGNYSVRCYANDTPIDGSNTSGTNIVKVEVMSKPSAPASLSTIDILNVTNNYRGDIDYIYCNATSVNGDVAANITLQFQNGTGWYTLNDTYWAPKVYYKNTYGTNPRYAQTVTTTGTAAEFAVYSNITGSQALRCNVSVGQLGSAVVNTSSTDSISISAPPLNTSMTTDLVSPISIFDNQSNNFNMTCNVSAVIGNASSVSLYAQWNSTADVWNNFSTGAGNMRANESSPMVFSNVDNFSYDSRVFKITGYVAGNYSIRCYANSTANDGTNENWTGMSTVNVLPVSLSNIAIVNVTNNYRGDTNNVYCNATSTNGNVQANVTLQFQNGTGWYTLNASYVAPKTAYDSAYGTNPRYDVAVTPAGNAVKFAVFSNITGSESLRCNVTQGLLSSAVVNTSSTDSISISAPLLNTSILTVPTEPITITDNQSNNFNITCNATAVIGNVSSVTVYAQFNSTNNIWNNFTTSAGSMRSNESSPIIFSNVGNSTFTNRRVFSITGYTAGNYAVRCFANSSTNDGANENWTSIVVVKVNDTTLPNLANVLWNVSDLANYSSVQRYEFNATVVDNVALSWVKIEHNFTGTLTNYTVSTMNGNEYYYDYGILAAGYYQFRWWANDTNGNLNSSIINYYQVNKSYLPMTLYINGTNGDVTTNNATTANFTANFSSSNTFSITLHTNLTGSMTLLDTQNSPLMKDTVLNPYIARTGYFIIANWSGNQNYTISNATHYLSLNESNIPNINTFVFNISNMTNYSSIQGYQFNATVSDANLDKVWIEQNFTGALQNVTIGSCGGSVYCYNYALAAGFYYTKWYANDSYGNLNNTDYIKYYQVNKSYLPMTLYINGTDGDVTANNATTANFTAKFSTSDTFSITLHTNLTGTMSLLDTQNNPLMKDTVLAPYIARTGYFIIANWSGNENYTISNATHYLSLNESAPPNMNTFLFNVSNMTNYSSIQGYQFNATITDSSLDKVWIEHNFSGALKNYSTTANNVNEYYYNNASLAAGFYSAKWYANDTYGNLNNTDWVHYYQVNKSYIPITLYINGTNGDTTLNNNSDANFTANFSSSYSFSMTLWTNLTGTTSLWDTQNSPLMNYTILNQYPQGEYLINANWSNQNYSYTEASHVLKLNATGTLLDITIGNVTDMYRGDTDNIYCNATAKYWNVSANISLQYNNGTIGGWINLNESNLAQNVSYVNTYGTNPRYTQTILTTPSGTVARFAVFGNWNGSNQFRCNVTQGSITAPAKNNISSVSTMAIMAPPLNTSLTTDLTAPIALYDDGSNNFNLTCNVSAIIGNATNVSLYAQWNSTADVWNNFSASGSLKANETSPLMFYNVDNSSPRTRVFKITGTLTGSYSVRCYANSSVQDGPNANWTNLAAVNVKSVLTQTAPASETIVDRDSVNASVSDVIVLTVASTSTLAQNITFKANLTIPSIGGQTDIVLGYNMTNSSGQAVYNWDPSATMYAGNYTWWAESNLTYVSNGTRTVLVYGGFNLAFQNAADSPNSSYVLGDNVSINATLKSFGPESLSQLSTTYGAGINSTVIKADSSFAQINLTYRTLLNGNWSGNYSLTESDPLSGNSYNVSLNSTANYFFTNSTDFTRSFNVLSNAIVSITLFNVPIDYSALDPGITSNASTIGGFPMIVRVDSITNVNVDINIKSNESTMGSGGNNIAVENQTFANNSVGTGNKSLTIDYQTLKISVPPNATDGTNVSAYWWIAVPINQPPGVYSNTIIVYTNQS